MAIIRVCVRTRAVNGGIIKIDELRERLLKDGSKSRQGITEEDIHRAIKKLSVLGNGYRLQTIGSVNYVVSVPMELNRDHELLVLTMQSNGYVSYSILRESKGWTAERFRVAMDFLVQEELVWVDNGTPTGEQHYLMPNF